MEKAYEKPSIEALDIILEGAILDGSIQEGEFTEEEVDPV